MVVLTKFRGVETDSIREQNEFLMMLLRAHCEMKQGRHVHDTVENRSEFLNQYLGGGNTIFMKAKRSLTSSFDNLLKRRASRDDFNPNLKEMTLPVNPILRVSLNRFKLEFKSLPNLNWFNLILLIRRIHRMNPILKDRCQDLPRLARIVIYKRIIQLLKM